VRRRIQLAGAVALLAVLGVVGAAIAGGGGHKISEKLTGYEEVPALSTTGNGKFQARVARFGDTIRYRLSYRDLEGSVTQAHIHIAQEAVNGDIVAFLCSNLPSPPPDTPACPASPGTVSGEIGPEDVLGPGPTDTTFQGIEPGAFDEFVDAIEAGVTYANVHTTKWPGGEIRAQLDDDKDRDHGGRD
jgi:hypothetical protein